MAGHVSEQDLAGVAVGANLFFPFFGSSLGIISGLTPVVAGLYGAEKHAKITFVIQQGFYWSLGLALLFILLGLFGVPLLLPQLARAARGVCGQLLPAGDGLRDLSDLPGWRAAQSHRCPGRDAHHYGNNGRHGTGQYRAQLCVHLRRLWHSGLGGVGAGVGTALAFYINLLLNVLVVSRLRPFQSYAVLHRLPRPALPNGKSSFLWGFPSAVRCSASRASSGAVGLFMTVYGTAVVAAHQAALNFTTMVYMIPLSVSMALTILVGYELGAGRTQTRAATAGWGGSFRWPLRGRLR